MGASCSVEDCSIRPQQLPPAVVLDAPLATRLLDEHINRAQPPLALVHRQPPRGDVCFDRSASSVSSSICGQCHDGSVNGSAHSSGAANQQLVMQDSVAMWHPSQSSPQSRRDRSRSPSSVRTAGAIRALGVISQCSLRSSLAPDIRQKAQRRGGGGGNASSLSTWSEGSSSNTWTQFVAHDTQAQPHDASGEAMWALAKFHSDCPLMC